MRGVDTPYRRRLHEEDVRVQAVVVLARADLRQPLSDLAAGERFTGARLVILGSSGARA